MKSFLYKMLDRHHAPSCLLFVTGKLLGCGEKKEVMTLQAVVHRLAIDGCLLFQHFKTTWKSRKEVNGACTDSKHFVCFIRLNPVKKCFFNQIEADLLCMSAYGNLHSVMFYLSPSILYLKDNVSAGTADYQILTCRRLWQSQSCVLRQLCSHIRFPFQLACWLIQPSQIWLGTAGRLACHKNINAYE